MILSIMRRAKRIAYNFLTTPWREIVLASSSRARVATVAAVTLLASPLMPARAPEIAGFSQLARTTAVGDGVRAAPGQQAPPASEPIPTLQQKIKGKTRVDSILEDVQAGKDGWLTELYDEEIKVQLGVLKELLGHAPIDQERLLSLVAPEFRGTPLRPEERDILRRQSPTVARYRVEETYAVTADNLGRELEHWYGELEEVISKELKTTGIFVQNPDPPQVKMQLRYNLTGRAVNGERLQLSGYWMTHWRKDIDRGWLWSGVELQEGWENRAARPLFTDISTCALPSGPANEQLLRGVDWWTASLDGAIQMHIHGHNGVAVGDVDGDGREDFYVCQGSGLPNRLFRNNGDGSYTEIARGAGVDMLDRSSSSLFIDYDNDGDQDLLVAGPGLTLFQNDGSGHFTLQDAAKIGLASPKERGSDFFSTCAADYNKDGWLDIYVTSYFQVVGPADETIPIPYHDATNGAPNYLFRSNGDGTFSNVTEEVGLNANNNRFSFACAWADYDKNGYPDLYVANDFGRNNLYRNNGDGSFADVTSEAGVEDIAAGMSVAWEDYDNDGWLDLYVGNMYSTAGIRTTTQPRFQPSAAASVRNLYRRHARGNSLFRNRGDGTFEDVSERAGVTMGRWAWSSNFLDFDLDGQEDLYVVNGFITNEDSHDL